MRAMERPVSHRQARHRSTLSRPRGIAVAVVAALAALAVGGAAFAQAVNPIVQVRYDATYGYYLTNAAGMTLYTFSNDTNGKSNCNGGCAAAWPPLEADSATIAPLNVPGSFSVITRDDGSKQVAYNGKPLYTFRSDTKPGDVAGQAFHDVWWVANLEPAVQLLATAKGTEVVGPTGMTLYTFGKDTAGVSNCSGTCALNWPPLVGAYDTAHGNGPVAGTGVSGTLGVIARADGGMQLTLDGKPLYYFRGDTMPGEAKGDGLLGLWQKVTQP
jgi:predicted lipoprotein with Yx(FWY)xxD motif